MKNRMKIAVTGSDGFLGKNLINFLSINPNLDIETVNRTIFKDTEKLQDSLKNVNVVIHLAGINRHSDEEKLYSENITIANKLLLILKSSTSVKQIIFSSSIQEKEKNQYGRAKKEIREKFSKWSYEHNKNFVGMVLPNIFGSHSKPFYNSVVATFCHQIANNENPIIIHDKKIPLVSVNKVCQVISELMINEVNDHCYFMQPDREIQVSNLLDKIKSLQNKNPAKIHDCFEKNLLLTFEYFKNTV